MKSVRNGQSEDTHLYLFKARQASAGKVSEGDHCCIMNTPQIPPHPAPGSHIQLRNRAQSFWGAALSELLSLRHYREQTADTLFP
ncbi:hypothetical protein JZ751_002528 [Albula glossodonta]|uniref:Uncharacterized protein n=1 Tax=Albula glossodonta TaxID=121402 RepID=A0A8T2NBM7_9TELE|nr:hypothetical protein JZ751_002528 [Albula glossodonta]